MHAPWFSQGKEYVDAYREAVSYEKNFSLLKF